MQLTDDQVTAQLWDLEEAERQDARVALTDGTYLSLFLDKVDMFLDRLRFPNEQRFNRENEEVGGDNNRHIQKRPKTQT